jgi:hypothetical protein
MGQITIPKALVSSALAAVTFFAARSSFATTPPATLMTDLGTYASRFESLKTRATYTVDGRMESVDSKGQVDSVKEMTARVEPDGNNKSRFTIVRYTEDGTDKTEEAKKKAQEDAKERAKKKDKRKWRMPFHPDEQQRYTFDVAETDAKDPTRVRITFVPKVKGDDTIEGSAWVDTTKGVPVSTGFKLSQTPTLVDSIHITVSFGEQTPYGPAPSKIDFDVQGGILFFHKHVRATANVKQLQVPPPTP